MTSNMGTLQKEFLNDSDVKFLSISVTPVMDSVPVLKEYAVLNKLNAEKWNNTLGAKKEIYDLARKFNHHDSIPDSLFGKEVRLG